MSFNPFYWLYGQSLPSLSEVKIRRPGSLILAASVERVRLNVHVPTHKFRRDAAAHSIIDHPNDPVGVGADAQNRVQLQVRKARPFVQLFVGQWRKRIIVVAQTTEYWGS